MFGTQQKVALNLPEAEPQPIPAPTKGWNKRDPLANMKPGYAPILDNWWVLPYSIQIRRGSDNWATGIGDVVNTLITYRPKSGVQELWAFAGDELIDASATGAVGAPVASGLQSDQWNCTNAATTGGNFLLCVDGIDLMLAYDGTDWEPIDGASTMFTISGAATSDLINLFVHGERIFYIEKASMNAWFTAVGAVGGALTKLDLSSVFKEGGYLLAGGSWSVDAGDGQDDYAAFITSEGEIAVYAGNDPSDATEWRKIGVFVVGRPIGRRCAMKYGGDLILLTVDGVISATAAFQRGRDDAKQLALSDAIQGAVAESGELYKDLFGWQMKLFSPASMLIVNVPESDGVKQWAMNTVTKAWTRFKDWETKCFEVFNDSLYFGASGAVVKAWTGPNDRGAAIVAEVLPAFGYFGSKSRTKQWNMLRPNIEWDANPIALKVGFDADFKIETPAQEIALSSDDGTTWDSGEWDEAVWGGALTMQDDWYVVDAIGLAGAPHMIFSSKFSTARIASFDVIEQQGTIF